MKTRYYGLRGREVFVCKDLIEWAKWFEMADRHIARTHVGDVTISTIFLGLDHSFMVDNVQPILFETMIFGGLHDDYQTRYATYEQAEAGHAKAVKKVRRLRWLPIEAQVPLRELIEAVQPWIWRCERRIDDAAYNLSRARNWIWLKCANAKARTPHWVGLHSRPRVDWLIATVQPLLVVVELFWAYVTPFAWARIFALFFGGVFFGQWITGFTLKRSQDTNDRYSKVCDSYQAMVLGHIEREDKLRHRVMELEDKLLNSRRDP